MESESLCVGYAVIEYGDVKDYKGELYYNARLWSPDR